MTDTVDNAQDLSNPQVQDAGASAPPAASIEADPAPAPTADPATGETEQANQGKPEGEPDWFKQRIRQMTRQRGDAERRANRAEARLEALERQLQSLQAAPPKSAELRPQDFPTYEAFVDARAEQKARAVAKEELAAGLQSRIEQETAASTQAQAQAFEEKARAQAEAADIDLDAVMDTLRAAPLLSKPVADYLFSKTQHPAQLAEYLAENPSELDRISRLGPALAERNLAKVEARFTPAPKPPPSVTKAPPPGPTVGGRAVHRPDWRSSNDMEDYAAGWLAEQERRAKMG